MNDCGCYYLDYSILNMNENSTRPCLTLNDSSCALKHNINFNVQECKQKYCPLECETFKYELSLSSLVNPHLKEFYSFNSTDMAYYESILGVKNLSYDFFKSTWVNVKVYYPSLQYTRISEVPKTSIIDLFTQIGGSLGMFVSFSIFTLFEFVEVALLMAYAFLFKNSNVAPMIFTEERKLWIYFKKYFYKLI